MLVTSSNDGGNVQIAVDNPVLSLTTSTELITRVQSSVPLGVLLGVQLEAILT